MPRYVNVNGVWKQEGTGYVNVNGVWKTKDTDYVNVNGVWKSASPYAKAQYYGPCYSLNQSGTGSVSYNSDGSLTIYSMSNYYAGEEDAKWRVVFSTPYQIKAGDLITAYGKFMYGNLGLHIGFSETMGTTITNSLSAFKVFNFYCTGYNGTTWEYYSNTYTGSDKTVYLHLEVLQYASYVRATEIISSIKINGNEILNSLA